MELTDEGLLLSETFFNTYYFYYICQMTMRQYLESITKEELIELLKKLEVNDIIITGAFASTENVIIDMIEKDFSKEVDEIVLVKKN